MVKFSPITNPHITPDCRSVSIPVLNSCSMLRMWWKLRMSCVELAWFCERMGSGVMACKTGVKSPFVSFDRIFWIEKA